MRSKSADDLCVYCASTVPDVLVSPMTMYSPVACLPLSLGRTCRRFQPVRHATAKKRLSSAISRRCCRSVPCMPMRRALAEDVPRPLGGDQKLRRSLAEPERVNAFGTPGVMRLACTRA